MQYGNEPVTIAVIDSGIDACVLDLGDYVIQETGYILDEHGKVREKKALAVCNPHGTGVALIIRHFCKNVRFISMDILDENLLSDGRILLHAFASAITQQPQIIHMSLGTTKARYRHSLKRLVKQAKKNNILVVAAASNTAPCSYPAYTKGVVGVKYGRFDDRECYAFENGFYLAPPDAWGIEGMGLLSHPVCGNSAAAACITGHSAKIICKLKNQRNINFIPIEEITGELYKSNTRSLGSHKLLYRYAANSVSHD